MAFQDNTARYSRPGRIGKFWNISGLAVGPIEMGQYFKDDVMLIQTFLKRIAENLRSGAGSQGPPRPIPAVDGFFGPITKDWLSFFQGKKELVPDGEVSKPPLGRSIGLRSGKPYCIFLLNEDFDALEHDWFMHLGTDSRTHPDLRAALRRNQPKGTPLDITPP